MKKLLISLLCLLTVGNSFGWGRVPHEAIVCIAEKHLTPKARKNIARYLDQPLVSYATYMDRNRDTPGFCKVQHTATATADMQLDNSLRNGCTSCVAELMLAMDRLKNYKHLSDSVVRLNLMYIVHIVGDMHCPGHVRYAGCKAAKKVNFNGKEMTYHAVWDSGIVLATHPWNYEEFQQHFDTLRRRQIRRITAGTPRDWFHQTAVASRVVYDVQRLDGVYDMEFVRNNYPLAEDQMIRAAYRLAAVLNELFG